MASETPATEGNSAEEAAVTPMEAPLTSEEVEAGVEPPVDEGTETPVEPAAAVDEAPVAAAEPAADVEATAAAAEAAQAEAAPAAAPQEVRREKEAPKREKKRLPRAEWIKRERPKPGPAAGRKPIVRLPKPEAERGRTQERRGVVVSSAMDKTIVVKVDIAKLHPRYKKVVRRSTKFHAHDERNEAKVGDVVRIVETRPLSKTKRWRLAEIVEVAK